MGCGSSTAASVIDQKKPAKQQTKNRKNRPSTPGPKSISFEVKLDGDDKLNDSYKIKMPKRLQRLEEQAASNNTITAEEIAERQKLAERRRKSALEEKILKSKQFQAKVQTASKKKSNSPSSIGSRNNTNNSLKSQKNSRTSTATIKGK